MNRMFKVKLNSWVEFFISSFFKGGIYQSGIYFKWVEFTRVKFTLGGIYQGGIFRVEFKAWSH